MKVQEAVQYMTKLYLTYIFDSFTEDVPKPSEEEARDKIIQHTDDLADPSRIQKRLAESADGYPDEILTTFILEALLNLEHPQATKKEIYRTVRERERAIQEEAESEGCFEYTPDRAVDILKTVIEVSVKDRVISEDERDLIERLREKLDLSRHDQYLILAQLDHFPQAGNDTHTHSDVKDALHKLQKAGVLFYCNQHPEDDWYVLPDELVDGARKAIGFELSERAKRLLFRDLTIRQLGRILEETGLPKSGSKAEVVDRVLEANIRPSEALDILTSNELYDILDDLPGAKLGRTKDERIQLIIDYWSNRTIRHVADDADPREIYYEYLTELAARDRENLLANDVISKDRDMDDAFEEGTRFLFEEKLGIDLVDLDGSERPDGCIQLGRDQVLMWDNKSKEDTYTFPKSHVKQFKRYIRNSNDRVSCFLIVVPDVADEAQQNVQLLKAESRDDTDVAVIAAEDLKWVAENWRERTDGGRFDPQVFNIIGKLDRQTLETRMDMLL